MAEFIKWINGVPCIREYFCWLALVNQHPELSQEYLINSRKDK